MRYLGEVIRNLSTIDIISAELDVDLKSFFTRTLSISIVVHNNDQSTLNKETHVEFEKFIASIELKIHTLHLMMDNIVNKSNDRTLVADIRHILDEVGRVLKSMSYKMFALRKAIATNNIIELRVVSDSLTVDVNNLRSQFTNLKSTAQKTKINLSRIQEEQK